MDSQEFRKRGKEMVDYVAQYLETIESRRVTPAVEPGYLKELIPLEAPTKPENWESIMKDIEDKIMIGMTHWQHPRFHAYFPSGASYPSILADILVDSIGCIGFSWASGPSCTELEGIVCDWFGKMMGLPKEFLQCYEEGNGGGCIQTSASECVLVAILAARAQALKKLKKESPTSDEGVLLSRLMAYCSKEAHSCLEKGAMIGFVKLRILEPDENFALQASTLKAAMEEDKANGLVPFFVSLTIGTTSCCSCDNLKDIGPLCEQWDIWLHVDAAYAGSAMICEEFRPLFDGIQYAMTLNTNTNKWLLTNFDCSCMWTRDSKKLTQALVVDPLYLQHTFSGKSIDYRHWGIPLSRRMRSLKLWFVIRIYGVEGLRKYIREHCRLAKVFEQLVLSDSRFEIMNKVQLGLVCFRMKGSNGLNQKLLSTINASGKLHMVPASLNDKYVIRFCVCREKANDDDMKFAWNVIQQTAEEVGKLYKESDEMQWKPPKPGSEVNHIDAQRASMLSDWKEVKTLKDLHSENEDDEEREKVYELLEEKKKKDLKYKRSFFVRMVSDPKIYNPKIVRARIPAVKAAPSFPPMDNSGSGHAHHGHTLSPSHFANNGLNLPSPSSNQQQSHSSPIASWISWPLALMLQDIAEEVTNRDVPFRFRNWESTLTIKPGPSGSSAKTSPENENLRPVSPNPFARRSRSPLPPSKSPNKESKG